MKQLITLAAVIFMSGCGNREEVSHLQQASGVGHESKEVLIGISGDYVASLFHSLPVGSFNEVKLGSVPVFWSANSI